MNADTDTDAIRKDDQSANLDPQQGVEPLACVSCRARKLKCDRAKPSCTRCTKVDNECLYPESRRKPTVKRKNVKELEARLGSCLSILTKRDPQYTLYTDFGPPLYCSSSGGLPQRGYKER